MTEPRALIAPASADPKSAAGLPAWLEPACDSELNRRRGCDYPLRLSPEAAIPMEADAGSDWPLLNFMSNTAVGVTWRIAPLALATASDAVADVNLYLNRLSDKLGIDPTAAANREFLANAKKCPADKVRRISKKYAEL